MPTNQTVARLESVIYVQSYKTAITLGAAAAPIMAAADRVPVSASQNESNKQRSGMDRQTNAGRVHGPGIVRPVGLKVDAAGRTRHWPDALQARKARASA
jgi:hypothetical protein